MSGNSDSNNEKPASQDSPNGGSSQNDRPRPDQPRPTEKDDSPTGSPNDERPRPEPPRLVPFEQAPPPDDDPKDNDQS